ncbi:hypothetical protein CDAR_450941 [Caerostris darwini]|uniref:Uncharacterized protein n=1 Tax=Caerostris darwini TaxID=1538125 RepID=A0AAV4PS29_9ARAC|nr:hypothetical protein CDAR_450941 [Caerostris darwini]
MAVSVFTPDNCRGGHVAAHPWRVGNLRAASGLIRHKRHSPDSLDSEQSNWHVQHANCHVNRSRWFLPAKRGINCLQSLSAETFCTTLCPMKGHC